MASPRKVDPDRQVVMIIFRTGVPPCSGTKLERERPLGNL